MKVKIIKSWKPDIWYSKFIGEVFKVQRAEYINSFIVVHGEKHSGEYIDTYDCEIVQEEPSDLLPTEFQNLVETVKGLSEKVDKLSWKVNNNSEYGILRASTAESIKEIGDRLDKLEGKQQKPQLYICENAEKCEVKEECVTMKAHYHFSDNPNIKHYCSKNNRYEGCIPYVESKMKDCCGKWIGASVMRRSFGNVESESLKRCQECGALL